MAEPIKDAVLVTGGAGFIGSNFIIDWLKTEESSVINIDKLTYAGNVSNLKDVNDSKKYVFVQGDICESTKLEEILSTYRPRAIINFAAESHVDRSISGPEEFIKTNILGTFRLLESAKKYWAQLPDKERDVFRFLHVSTDEVYGTLGENDPPFSETTAYKPNSPYSASKASSDHLVRAYFHTYGFPVLTTNCSNNYGAFQFPEKLVPLIIHNALAGKNLPIYGDGMQIRDWLYVNDHCSAIRKVLSSGTLGEIYNIGGLNEMANIEIVHKICELLEELAPENPHSLEGGSKKGYKGLITYVKDRPGHDRRYAINAAKIEAELGWSPSETFETGIEKTVKWYLNNSEWTNSVVSGEYRNWVKKHYS
ncbi:dTDP-glucose 4,6-dehydratase [Planctomycetota bacterium]|jgi:dTDP-glucose 4,6-dehydratase|nr:dTDP-glucose 4,6-dehydratase [Planctomycetota bacterium]